MYPATNFSHEISDLIRSWLSENPRRSLKKLSMLTGVSKSYLGSMMQGELPGVGILMRLSSVLPKDSVMEIAIDHYPEFREILLYAIDSLSSKNPGVLKNIVRRKDETFMGRRSLLEDEYPCALNSDVM